MSYELSNSLQKEMALEEETAHSTDSLETSEDHSFRFQDLKDHAAKTVDYTLAYVAASLVEIKDECYPSITVSSMSSVTSSVLSSWESIYFPALHSPGWLLRYTVGPHTPELIESLLSDVSAGITVALTLVPQVLGFAALANLPPIVGLYTSVIPSAVYIFFGSSMALAVGPTAILSLLTGQLISEYGIEPGSQDAVDLAGQATFCCGVILLIMAVFNLGKLIQLISFPVMR